MPKSIMSNIKFTPVRFGGWNDNELYKSEAFKKLNGNSRVSPSWGVEIECLIDQSMANKINRVIKNLPIYHGNMSALEVIQLELDIRSIEKVINYFLIGTDGSIRINKGGDYPVEFKSHVFLTYDGIDVIEDFYNTIKPKFNTTCGIHLNIGKDSIKNFGTFFSFLIIYHKMIANHFSHSRISLEGGGYVLSKSLPYHKEQLIDLTNKLEREVYYYLSNNGYELYNHYNIINTARNGRLEIRTLGGTVDIKNVLEFIKTILIGLELCNDQRINEKTIAEFLHTKWDKVNKLTNALNKQTSEQNSYRSQLRKMFDEFLKCS